MTVMKQNAIRNTVLPLVLATLCLALPVRAADSMVVDDDPLAKTTLSAFSCTAEGAVLFKLMDNIYLGPHAGAVDFNSTPGHSFIPVKLQRDPGFVGGLKASLMLSEQMGLMIYLDYLRASSDFTAKIGGSGGDNAKDLSGPAAQAGIVIKF